MSLMQLKRNTGIKNIKEFFTDLKKALDDEGELVLDFSSLKRIDLSVAQALIAAHKIARNAGKVIKLKGISSSLKDQLKIAGLAK